MQSRYGSATVRRWMGRAALGLVFAVAGGRAAAVERKLEIVAPTTVTAGADVGIAFAASTDAGRGEQVGFLQAEFSTDGGRTWTALCYVDNVGPKVERHVSVKSGATGTSVRLRARAAFRDGLAGDVDYTGAAIRWHESWGKWEAPPAKFAEIAVTAR